MRNRMAISFAGLVAVMAVAMVAAFTTPAAAQNAKIATVDIRSVAENHPLLTQWEEQFKKTQTDRNNQITAYLKQKYNLPDDPAKANLTEEQKKEIQSYLMAENQKFQEEMQASRDTKMAEVEDSIIKSVEAVAKANGIAYVFDSSALIFGGENITQLVINEINKTAGAPAPAPKTGK